MPAPLPDRDDDDQATPKDGKTPKTDERAQQERDMKRQPAQDTRGPHDRDGNKAQPAKPSGG